MWEPELSKNAYPTRVEFVRACVPILRSELELLKSEGVTIVQIDDPHLCLFVDPGYRKRFDDADAAARFDVETINELVDGIDGLKTAVHLCRRAGARARGEARYTGGYGPIINQLNALAVDHLTLEFTAPEAGDMAIFDQLRSDFEIGLGCVGTEPGMVDPIEAIVARVEKAMKYISPERITLNPDCGFAPGSAATVSIDEVYQKLKNDVSAAERLRERYD